MVLYSNPEPKSLASFGFQSISYLRFTHVKGSPKGSKSFRRQSCPLLLKTIPMLGKKQRSNELWRLGVGLRQGLRYMSIELYSR
jgi:hypothetical protein